MRGGIDFEAQGKTRTLRYTTNRLVSLEEKAGRTIQEVAKSMQNGAVSFADLRLMMQIGAGLPNATDAGDVIDDIGLAHAVELIGAALTAAFGQADQSAEGNGAAA
jgi:hypothetical protein